MGQQPSDLKQSRSQVPQINSLTRIRGGIDVRYGEIQIMQTKDEHMLAYKNHVFQDDSQWMAFQQSADREISEKNCFMIKMIDLQHSTEKELCTQLTQAHSVYEFFLKTLEMEIEEVAKARHQFDELEIIAMIYCTLQCLGVLKQKNSFHGDIRPCTVSLTTYTSGNPLRKSVSQLNAAFKLTDIMSMTDMNAYRRVVAKIEGQYNLSPENLVNLKSRILRPTYDPIKSDIFSIGMTALQMARLHNLKDIYDMQELKINKNKLDEHIREMRQSYTESISSVICELLQLAPENRPDLKQASSLLAPYQSQLQDYFNGSTIQAIFPNYQVKIDASTKQPFSDISNKPAAANLFSLLDKLDERARTALRASQEAQDKYYRLSAKQKNPNSNFQSYSDLQPISVQDVQFFNQNPNRESESIRESYNYNYNSPQAKQYPPQQKQIHYPDEEEQHQNYQFHQQDLEDQNGHTKKSFVEQFDPTSSNQKLQSTHYHYQQNLVSQQYTQQQHYQDPYEQEQVNQLIGQQDDFIPNRSTNRQSSKPQERKPSVKQDPNLSNTQKPMGQTSTRTSQYNQSQQQMLQQQQPQLQQTQYGGDQRQSINPSQIYPKQEYNQEERRTPLQHIQQDEDEFDRHLTGSEEDDRSQRNSQFSKQGSTNMKVPPASASQRTKRPVEQNSQKVVQQSQKSVTQSRGGQKLSMKK